MALEVVKTENTLEIFDSFYAETLSVPVNEWDVVNSYFVGVLKGAFIFLSDLIRKISIPVKVDFIGASSYGPETFSSENIQLTKKLEVDIKDKDVLVIEDIVDTGLTLAYMVDYLNSFSPRSVKTCALIDKHEQRKIQLKLDYVCHRLEKGFCVGYGLDYDGHYRNLPEIYHLKL